MELKWLVLAIMAAMYILVIIFQNKKIWFTTGAALIVIIIGAVTPVHALTVLINWNILMIYIGSLVIAELFIYSKIPARIADSIINISPNAGIAMVAILIMTGFISAFVENVATVLVMAPIALSLCKKLKIKPVYFMVGLAVMANLQGTATLVGDPPSMIFASYAHYSFNEFFFHEGKFSIFWIVQTGMLAGAIYFYFVFARQGKEKIPAEKTKVISWFPLIILISMIVGLAFSGTISALGQKAANANESLANPASAPIWTEYVSGGLVMILAIAGIIWYSRIRKAEDKTTVSLIKGLDWETIAFLCGIFIVIGSVSESGLLQEFAFFLQKITGGNVALGFIIIIAVSVIISGFVDNVPYIIVMLPVAATLAKNMNLQPELYMFALLVGSCLGGNLTPFGASANIVSIGILKKEGYPMNFGGWLKIGLPFTIITTSAASLLLWVIFR